MPKSKNNRKMRKTNKSSLKVTAPKPSAIINHSPNSTLLATLINNNDLNGLSFFIKELCHESKLTFDHNSKEWFEIFIESIQKDLSLAKYVAKNIYYNIASDNYNDNTLKANEIISDYIWLNCSNTYKNECIFPISIELQGSVSFIEIQRFTDSSVKCIQLLSHITDYYQHSNLKSAKNRQSLQRKLANF
jgi:hypothetical protein